MNGDSTIISIPTTDSPIPYLVFWKVLYKTMQTIIWMFPKIGIPQNGWFIMDNPVKMDDLGVPLFLETPICTSSSLQTHDDCFANWCRFCKQICGISRRPGFKIYSACWPSPWLVIKNKHPGSGCMGEDAHVEKKHIDIRHIPFCNNSKRTYDMSWLRHVRSDAVFNYRL